MIEAPEPRKPSLSTGRLGAAVVLATLAFYAGPLIARFNAEPPGTELTLSLALSALGGVLPALVLRRYPELRRGVYQRMGIAVMLMLGATGLRHVLLYQAQWSGQALSAVTFLVLLAVGLVYVYPLKP